MDLRKWTCNTTSYMVMGDFKERRRKPLETVIIELRDGILKVVDIPENTQVIFRDPDAGVQTSYKKEPNGDIIWKKRRPL